MLGWLACRQAGGGGAEGERGVAGIPTESAQPGTGEGEGGSGWGGRGAGEGRERETGTRGADIGSLGCSNSLPSVT